MLKIIDAEENPGRPRRSHLKIIKMYAFTNMNLNMNFVCDELLIFHAGAVDSGRLVYHLVYVFCIDREQQTRTF